jgi:hypothetical protein
MPTTTFALFRNRNTGEQRILEASGDNIALAEKLVELTALSIVEGHFLVVVTDSVPMLRPAWGQVQDLFLYRQAWEGIEAFNGGEEFHHLIVQNRLPEGRPSFSEGNWVASQFEKRFAARLN